MFILWQQSFLQRVKHLKSLHLQDNFFFLNQLLNNVKTVKLNAIYIVKIKILEFF